MTFKSKRKCGGRSENLNKINVKNTRQNITNIQQDETDKRQNVTNIQQDVTNKRQNITNKTKVTSVRNNITNKQQTVTEKLMFTALPPEEIKVNEIVNVMKATPAKFERYLKMPLSRLYRFIVKHQRIVLYSIIFLTYQTTVYILYRILDIHNLQILKERYITTLNDIVLFWTKPSTPALTNIHYLHNYTFSNDYQYKSITELLNTSDYLNLFKPVVTSLGVYINSYSKILLKKDNFAKRFNAFIYVLYNERTKLLKTNFSMVNHLYTMLENSLADWKKTNDTDWEKTNDIQEIVIKLKKYKIDISPSEFTANEFHQLSLIYHPDKPDKCKLNNLNPKDCEEIFILLCELNEMLKIKRKLQA